MLQNIIKQMQLPMRNITRTLPVRVRNFSAKSEETTPVGVEDAIKDWRGKLKKAGIGNVDFNLKCMVAHVLKRKFNSVPEYLSMSMNDKQVQELNRLCEARCGRMPLQYIIGEWDFMNITLKTAPTVFIPRPETEEFVQKVINEYRNVNEVNLLEVGCGSGAMSLAILHELPQVRSFAIERSQKATALAKENAKLLGLDDRFEVFNHTMETDNYLPSELCEEHFDVIISNPPYVKTEEFQYLQPEVTAYENINALDGGPDGLRIARLVFDLASLYLRFGGKLWLELGADHPQLVQTIMNRQYTGRLKYVASYKDQYEQERFVEIERV